MVGQIGASNIAMILICDKNFRMGTQRRIRKLYLWAKKANTVMCY